MGGPRVPLGWKNLVHDKRRLALSTSGVAFAVMLILMQLGFRNALLDSQIELLRQLNCDLVLVSDAKYRLVTNEPIPRRRIYQAKAHEAIASAWPLYIEPLKLFWKDPETGNTHTIRVLGFDPDEPVFLNDDIERHRLDLRTPDTVLLDRGCRTVLGLARSGVASELEGRNVRVVGTFNLGSDFVVDGNLITSDRTFLTLTDLESSRPQLRKAELGLLRLKPGFEPDAVRQSLSAMLPSDIQVLTKQEVIDIEWNYWLAAAAVGTVFDLGVVVGFLVGFIICYQILFTELSDHLPQFATLRALGHGNGRLIGVVLSQAFFLSLFGFFPAALIGDLLYRLIARFAGLEMRLTFDILTVVFVLTVSMCMFSGLVAARKAMKTDPAEVF